MGSSRFARRVAVGLLASATAIGLSAMAGPASAAPQARHPLSGSMPRWLPQAHDTRSPSSSQQVGFGVLLGMRNQAGAAADAEGDLRPDQRQLRQVADEQGVRRAATRRPRPASPRCRAGCAGRASRSPRRCPAACTWRPAVPRPRSRRRSGPRCTTTPTRARPCGRTPPSCPCRPAPRPRSPAWSPGSSASTRAPRSRQPADTLPGPPPGARYGVQPCSAYYGQKIATDQPSAYGKHQPYAVCGYVPQQYQSAYGETGLLRSGVNGHGVTVAITDAYAAPTICQDAQKYNRVHGQPPFTPGQFSPDHARPRRLRRRSRVRPAGLVRRGDPRRRGRARHGARRQDRLRRRRGLRTGLDDAWASAIDNHVADVITNSWTDGTDDISLLGTAYVAVLRAVLAGSGADRHHRQLLHR